MNPQPICSACGVAINTLLPFCAKCTLVRRGLAEEPDRDPTTTPEPGDVLCVGADQREVVDVMGDRIEYGFPGRAAKCWLSLFEWQRWARKADVVKVAA